MNGLKVKEVAQKWGMSEDKVRQLCRDGKISGAEKTSAGWCIPYDAVNPYASKAETVDNTVLSDSDVSIDNINVDNTVTDTVNQDNPDLIKQFFIRLLCFLFSLGVIILGLCVMFGVKKFLFGLIIIVVGVILTVWSAQAVDEASKKIKIRLSTDKQLKKKIVTLISSVVAVAVLIPVIILTVNTSKGVYGRNAAAKKLLNAPIDKNIYLCIEEFETECSQYNGLSGLFFGYKREIKEVRAKADNYVLEYAAELEEKIDNLQPVTMIESSEKYDEVRSNISSLCLYNSEFDNRVKSHVSNYSKLEAYERDFEQLRDTYWVSCSGCGGDGDVTCSYCYGQGKNLVTWYEYGDWGETSYSTYDCNYCNGSGKKSCNICSGRGGNFIYHP